MTQDDAQEHGEQAPEGGTSRRQLLTRVAAGTALAWAAPQVLTMQPAFAQGSGQPGGTPVAFVCAGNAVLAGETDSTGMSTSTSPIGVDDDLLLVFKNETKIADNDNLAQEFAPVDLGPIASGDTLQVVARNRSNGPVSGDACSIDPLYVYCGQTRVALDTRGVRRAEGAGGCARGEIFYDRVFTFVAL